MCLYDVNFNTIDMSRNIYLLFISLVIAGSCNEKESPINCGVENPIEDHLAWLEARKESLESSGNSQYLSLIQATNDGQIVFFVGSCCPNCLMVDEVFDCQGNVIEGVSINDVRNQKLIWKPENSACTFDHLNQN